MIWYCKSQGKNQKIYINIPTLCQSIVIGSEVATQSTNRATIYY
jgi:hypothetical protein